MTTLAAAPAARAFWYLTRGTGVAALVMLTTSVVLGILTSLRWSAPRWPRFVIEGLHRSVSLCVVIFLGLHIATAVLDGFAPISWLDAVIPFRSPYRPVWLGLGAVAFDLLVAVILTSLFRVRLGYRVWRFVHWMAYACWPVALLHGLGTGTDTQRVWMLALDAAAVIAVVLAVWTRIAEAPPEAATARAIAGVASVVVPLAMCAWAFVGPLRQGWARTAGTPTSLLKPKTANGRALRPATAAVATTSTGGGQR
ncbi:MAG TPA: ferric reductase-like transmembrane domain-containing protein [Acidimicrobiia bacterium]|nr:ferric reductase-like transmembrane domain-containing protein [Acidimicrobiia bacterium]